MVSAEKCAVHSANTKLLPTLIGHGCEPKFCFMVTVYTFGLIQLKVDKKKKQHTHLESFSTKKEENNKDKQASIHAVTIIVVIEWSFVGFFPLYASVCHLVK